MQNQEFLIYRLSNASQEAVYSWLEANQPKKDGSIFSSGREELESALLLRDEPLVKLGLALFGHEQETGISLYKNPDKLIKKAVLSGTTIRRFIGESWIENHGILVELLNTKNSELLGALLSNPLIDDNILVDLFEKKDCFEIIDDEFWYELIGQSLSNSRLSTPYDKRWMDGWAEYSYSRVFSAGWKLFEKLPVNDKSAILLAYLGEKLLSHKPHDMTVSKVIERWKQDCDEKSIDYYALCRKALANLIKDFEVEFEKLRDSNDVSLRQSYYRRFSPLQKEEVRELFEKDDDKFLEEALENKNLYRKEDIRDELRQCCWDYKDPHHDMLYPNIFNSRVEQLSKKYPEWFGDRDDKILVDSIEDPLEKANKQLEHIGRKISAISENLFEAGNEEKPLLEEIRDSLNNIAGHLYKLKNSPAYGWVWIIAGFVIGYLVGYR